MGKYIRYFTNYICLIPFVFILCTAWVIDHNLVNGVVSGKYFWFYFSIGLVSLASIISFIINQEKIKFSFVDISLSTFCILGSCLTYLLNGQITTKLVLLTLLLALYFFFRIFLFQYKSSSHILVVFLLITGLIEAVWGLKQLYGFSPSQHNLFKATGSFFNPGPYAGYLAMIFPIALYFILKDWNIVKMRFRNKFLPFYFRWIISALTFVCILVILPATMSRASWIAALGGSCLVLILCLIQVRYNKAEFKSLIKRNRKNILMVSSISFIAICVGLAGMYYLKKDSADGRTLIWKVTSQTISDYPMGVGIGGFAGIYGNQQAKYFESGLGSEQEEYVAGNPEYAFNEYLQLCIEFGVIPFFLFLAAIISAIYIGIKRRKIAPVGGLVSLLIFASMSYPFNLLPFLIVFCFLLALCVSKGRNITYYQDLQNFHIYDFQTRSRLNKIAVSFLLFFSVTATAFCLYNRYPTYKAYKDWNKAKMLYNINSFEKASDLYCNLYPLLNDQISFLFEYGQSLSKSDKYPESNIILQEATLISCDPMIYTIIGKNYQALKQYNRAEEYYKKSANIVPSRLYPSYLLVKMYIEAGQEEEAEKLARTILHKDVKVDSPAVKEMKREMKQILENK